MHSIGDAPSFCFFPVFPGAARRRVERLDSLITQRKLRIARISALLAARKLMLTARDFGFLVDLGAEVSRTTNDPDFAAVAAVEIDAESFSVAAGRIAADRDMHHAQHSALVDKRALVHVALAPRLYVSPDFARAMRAV